MYVVHIIQAVMPHVDPRERTALPGDVIFLPPGLDGMRGAPPPAMRPPSPLARVPPVGPPAVARPSCKQLLASPFAYAGGMVAGPLVPAPARAMPPALSTAVGGAPPPSALPEPLAPQRWLAPARACVGALRDRDRHPLPPALHRRRLALEFLAARLQRHDPHHPEPPRARGRLRVVPITARPVVAAAAAVAADGGDAWGLPRSGGASAGGGSAARRGEGGGGSPGGSRARGLVAGFAPPRGQRLGLTPGIAPWRLGALLAGAAALLLALGVAVRDAYRSGVPAGVPLAPGPALVGEAGEGDAAAPWGPPTDDEARDAGAGGGPGASVGGAGVAALPPPLGLRAARPGAEVDEGLSYEAWMVQRLTKTIDMFADEEAMLRSEIAATRALPRTAERERRCSDISEHLASLAILRAALEAERRQHSHPSPRGR